MTLRAGLFRACPYCLYYFPMPEVFILYRVKLTFAGNKPFVIMRPAFIANLLAAAVILCTACGCNNSGNNQSALEISDLRVEALYEPLAIDCRIPHFSWILNSVAEEASQTAYQILVASSPKKLKEGDVDLWDSGKIESRESNFIEYAGSPLQPRTLAYWKVRVWDQDGTQSRWSGTSRFGIGMLEEDDWDGSARFIGLKEYSGADEIGEYLSKRTRDLGATPLLRRVFDCDPKKGTMLLHVNSLGYHEAYINGEKVTEAVLAPAVSQFGKRSRIVTYDVSNLINKGRNEIVLWLGDGWYQNYLDNVAKGGPYVRAELDAVTPEGAATILVTDAGWQAAESGRLTFGNWRPHQMGGEIVDGRRVITDLKAKTLDGLDWTGAKVAEVPAHMATPQMCELNAVKESFHPVSVTECPDGGFIYDFGRCFVGFTEVKMPEIEEGKVVELHYDDYFMNDKSKLRDWHYTDFYIGNGEPGGSFSSKFNYKGFRLLKIKGIEEAVPLQDITGSSVSTDYSGDVSFACSDKDLNDIFNMIHSTVKALTLGGYMVDCPQIERLGYGGDGNASTPTVQTFFNLAPLYMNWMEAWADSQRENGDMPHTAPNPYSAGGGPYWCGFVITASWQAYVNYGDKRLLERYYPQMVKWLGFAEQNKKDGLLKEWAATELRNWYLGDWATPVGINQTDVRSIDVVNNCFLSDCYATMAKIAEVIGKDEDIAGYMEQSNKLNALIHKSFFDKKDKTYSTGTQIDLVYPMLVGATPAAEVGEVVSALKKRTAGEYKGHLATGLVGVPVITQWAIENGEAEFMYNMLKKRDYPGYLYMIDNGATMTWEHWNGERSHIHNCYNGIGRWFIQALAGITPDEAAPGYRNINIRPQLVDGISWVEASKDTPYGPLQLRWESDGKNFVLEVSVPVGSTATVVLPDGSAPVTLVSGSHQLSCGIN